MAEGWARHLFGDSIEAYSAGTNPTTLNPLAVQVMAEAGVDISRHQPKHLDSLLHESFDLVVTVCDHAQNSCPVPPAATRVMHVPFDDPPKLASSARSEEHAIVHYRRVRDEIKAFMAQLGRELAPLT